MYRYGLIGYPLTHSFSPKYFAEKFKQNNLNDYLYELYPLNSIDELPGLINLYKDLMGLNVTIPYKKEVLQYLDVQHEIVQSIQSCNCIKFDEGKLWGYNTDFTGFEQSLIHCLKPWHTHALILGTGGSASAVQFALQQLGIAFLSATRKGSGYGFINYSDITPQLLNDYTLIINTTPLGMFPDVDVCPALPYDAISDKHLLFDLIYNPEETLFLKKGKARGASIKNGLEMLVIQAEESWKIWNE